MFIELNSALTSFTHLDRAAIRVERFWMNGKEEREAKRMLKVESGHEVVLLARWGVPKNTLQ